MFPERKVIDHKTKGTNTLPPHPQVLWQTDSFGENRPAVRKPTQTQLTPSEMCVIALYSSMFITYLYILSIGALDRLSSPKGVREAGRTTPKKNKKIHN